MARYASLAAFWSSESVIGATVPVMVTRASAAPVNPGAVTVSEHLPFALRSPVCPLMDESAKTGRPFSSEAKPTMDPVGYSPPCSLEKVEMTPYLPRSTSVRHSSANESFAAVDWCSLKATISGSRFSMDTALSALTSCARTTRRDLPPARAVDRAARAAWEARARSARVGAMSLEASDIEDARGTMEASDVSDGVVHDGVVHRADFQTRLRQRAGEGRRAPRERAAVFFRAAMARV